MSDVWLKGLSNKPKPPLSDRFDILHNAICLKCGACEPNMVVWFSMLSFCNSCAVNEFADATEEELELLKNKWIKKYADDIGKESKRRESI